MNKIQSSSISDLGTFKGEIMEVTDDQYVQIKKLSKDYYTNGFEMTGAHRPTRRHVPLISLNAKICTISSEGTSMLQAIKRIFGLHMAQ
jgi:hypothetical protein